jgi:hypothetical protein
MLEQYVERIKAAAAGSRTEGALQVRLEPLLTELLANFGVRYKPAVNESLAALRLSQADSGRPDSLFGHVILDYKTPGLLARTAELLRAQDQVGRYLDAVTGGRAAEERAQWAGVLWDGPNFCHCHWDGQRWVWSKVHPVSAASLLTLVGIYRALQRKPMTAQLLAESFGRESEAAHRVLETMCALLAKPRHRTNMLFREWRRLFEQVSTYELDQLPTLKKWARSVGVATKDASQILFAIHSYYALVVKLLTSELLAAMSPVTASSPCERIAKAADAGGLYRLLGALEGGEHWRNFRISNFLEGDFFSWYASERSAALAGSIQELAREFLQFEPATAALKPEPAKDLLKEFYTALVDEQLRHDLGEYYTPDWLAQHVLDRAGYRGELDVTVLDPACGSGTFLVECLGRLRRQAEKAGLSEAETLATLLRRVRGMDLNPLAVISARANFLLAIADLVFSLGGDVEIPVYLADCINVPPEATAMDGLEIFQFSLDTEVGTYACEVPSSLVRTRMLGQVLLACEDAISQRRTVHSFLNSVRALPGLGGLLDDRMELRLTRLFEMMAQLDARQWNRIWCRIVNNNIAPSGLGQVDLIVGNPPWVRWSRLPQTYRERVKSFCRHYGLVSGRGYSGGIESDISTVVLYSAADHWLREGGRVAFLITWTVFKSASARGFRLGVLPDGTALRVEALADLTATQPFPDATNETSVYLGSRVPTAAAARFTQIPCEIWRPRGSARIDPTLPLAAVLGQTSVESGVACPVSEWGSPLWTGTERDYAESSVLRGRSAYLEQAHRGTISDLARVFWVKVEKYSSRTNRALIRTLTEEELPGARQVEPVEGAWIESDLLYPLARGRDTGRFSLLTEDWYQLVPNRHYEAVESEVAFAEKYPCAYSYFLNYRGLLVRRSTYKRYQRHLPFYAIYCVGDYTFAPWKVVWMEQQDPRSFRCAVASEHPGSLVPNKLVIPDHKLYFAALTSAEEAHFLCAYLNSAPVRTWLGGFLHGKQIGTSVFEFMFVPTFDPAEAVHRRLAEISLEAHRARAGARSKEPLPPALERELADLVRSLASRPRSGVPAVNLGPVTLTSAK